MRTDIAGALTVSIAAACTVAHAQASEVSFGFNGLGFNASGILTIAPNVAPADPNPNCGTPGNNACRTDPPGAFRIAGITGTFSGTAAGIFNAPITGVVPIHPANERDPVFDPLVPSSLSFVDYGGSTPGALTYNDLYFPSGSPIDCDFPFSGTFVDVFGVAFQVAGGYTVDLWGDGDMFGPGTTTYGVGVTDGHGVLAYEFSGVDATAAPVPEPSSLSLLGGGLVALLGWRRRGAASTHRVLDRPRRSGGLTLAPRPSSST